eukprot:448534_1
MDKKPLQYDKLISDIISKYKTKASQFKALKQALYMHFDEKEAESIAKQKMKEFNPNDKSGKSEQIIFVEQKTDNEINTIIQMPSHNSVPLLTKLDETIAFLDDWNFTIDYYKNVFIPQITYYNQLTGWTCGAASIRMVLETLINVKLSENELIKLLNTNAIDGTLQKNMISIG